MASYLAQGSSALTSPLLCWCGEGSELSRAWTTCCHVACGKRHNLLELKEGLERAVGWYKSRR